MKSFRELVDERLEDVTLADRTDALIRQLRQRAEKTDDGARRIRRPAVAALAMAIVLLAATALAVGLNFSRQYTVTRAAKQAVMDKYGLDSRSLEMFLLDRGENSGVWTFTFTHWAEERAGVYTVTISPDGETEARWSFDGTDPAVYADGSLDAPVWGPKQVEADRSAREAANRAAMEAERARESAQAAQQPDEATSAPETASAAATASTPETALEAAALRGDAAEAASAPETALEAASQPAPIPTPTHADGVRIADAGSVEAADTRLSVREALSLANAALAERFQVSEKALSLFQAVVNYDSETGLWTAAYQVNPGKFRYGWHEMFEVGLDETGKRPQLAHDADEQGRLGEYTVVLSDADGAVASAEWSLAGVDENVYTAETWGQAAAYGGPVLDWVCGMLEAREAILYKYDHEEAWLFKPASVEDNAALDQMLLDVGFPMEPYYKHVLPEAGDLSLEAAKELFYQALHTECGVTREVFDESVYAYAELTQETDGRQWYFWLQNAQEQMSWSVIINAETGEIIDLWMDPLAAGNG